MFKDKKAIIFDMDGTLIDSVGIWNEVDRRLITELGGNPEFEDVREQRDRLLRELKGSESPYTEYCSYLGRKYGSELSGEAIMKKRYDIAETLLINSVDYKKDAPEFLHMLKERGYILVICSTTRRKNMDIYMHKNANIMKKAPLDKFFDRVYTREDVSVMKPDPEIYLKALFELSLLPEECLVFEDSRVGVEAAVSAGIDTVAIYDRYSAADTDIIEKMTKACFEDYNSVIQCFEQEDI